MITLPATPLSITAQTQSRDVVVGLQLLIVVTLVILNVSDDVLSDVYIL